MEAWLLYIIIFGIVLFERNQLTKAECKEPDPVSHAYKNLLGDQVTYECMDSFRLVGKGSRTCDHGTWISDPPECIIDCGVPSEGFGAVVTYNDTLKGSVAEYTCKTNFTSRDSKNAARTCSSDGRWSGSPLKCTGTEDLARGKEASNIVMTDGDRQTCATYGSDRGTTSSLTVILSSDSNIYYNVHEVELDLQISTTQGISSNLNEGVQLQVFVQTSSSSMLCKRLGVYDSGVYRFTCATEEIGGSKMKIQLLHHDGGFRTNVCDIQVYGSRYTGECERPPIVVGARANFTSTYWNSKAVYSCVPPYRYAGGNNVITCHFGGNWTTPSIICKEMENLAQQAMSTLSTVIDDDRSTCYNVSEIELNLMTRREVQWIVVSTISLENSDMSVELTINNNKTTKTCTRSPSASVEGYVMTAFTCQGYPFADTVTVTGGSSKGVCEIEVYGRSASQGVSE